MSQPKGTESSPESGERYRSLVVPLSRSMAPVAEEILHHVRQARRQH